MCGVARVCSSRLRSSVPAALAVAALVGLPTSGRAAERPKLPARTLRGPAAQLNQYPTLGLATGAQRAASERLLADMRRAARPWRNPAAARAAGFDLRTARRRPGDRSVGILHAEHRPYRNDDHYLDPTRPETLVYVNAPGRPLTLIGVMFSMPRGARGPNPGGPITRWHTHLVCMVGNKRGLSPRADGSCPAGAVKRQGSEMLHVWFTRDLRSAFAIHAPYPELCRVGLIPATACGSRHEHHG